ncbi:MAG: hypothetical protein R3324_02655 [Halobacteriales archaeon]|nr:hypothetical protein [Halobacteriales archaeon]
MSDQPERGLTECAICGVSVDVRQGALVRTITDAAKALLDTDYIDPNHVLELFATVAKIKFGGGYAEGRRMIGKALVAVHPGCYEEWAYRTDYDRAITVAMQDVEGGAEVTE